MEEGLWAIHITISGVLSPRIHGLTPTSSLVTSRCTPVSTTLPLATLTHLTRFTEIYEVCLSLPQSLCGESPTQQQHPSTKLVSRHPDAFWECPGLEKKLPTAFWAGTPHW